ncbi:MAG: TonB-dependent receptor [Cyclobacteriaceae bacterium]
MFRLVSVCLLSLLALSAPRYVLGQTGSEADTLMTRELEEVIVTATRNERTMGALPMPVSLISQSKIKTMGSLRLNEVLTEQTGLVVVPQVNGQGNGIQLQGLNPEYTLILIDGEPVVGRNTGTLELSRLTVGNIKQIEIVKGPSSSLYGSEALAGVINIITERPAGTKYKFTSRYGTNNTLDLGADMSFTNKRLGVYVFGNRYSTDGYDLSPENPGQTVSPLDNYTFNSKITYQFSNRTDLSVAGRFFHEDQRFNFEVIQGQDRIRTSGDGATVDWNINPVLTHRFNDRLKTIARFYATKYDNETNLSFESDGSSFYSDELSQSFLRPELNAEYYFNDRNILTVGAGYISESVQTTRYDSGNKRFQYTSYGFFQHEWLPVDKWSVILGGRYDHSNIYGSQFSPKLSSQFDLNKRVTFKASVGKGFKAPDFRQVYLNFTNPAAGGYSVLGSAVAPQRLAELEAQGQLQTLLLDPSQIGQLDAEESFAINVGANVEVLPKLKADVNLFYNDINNLIETQIVATTISNQNIYSYRNIQRAYTQGLESNLSYPVAKNLSLSVGYQLLYAKDKDVEDAVENGEVFYRDPNTLITKRLKSGEYFGLYNRSRHSGNFKLFYANQSKGLEASLRVIFRGKFGIGDLSGSISGESIPASDRNSNAILDDYDDFVEGYALVNLSVAKSIDTGFRFQVGVDNLFDYTEPVFIPNLPGRIMYAAVSYSFSKKHK